MAKITTLKNKQNDILYPQTTAEAVYTSNGNTVASELAQLEKSKLYLGYFDTPEALPPIGKDGQYANIGSTDTIWVWDKDTNTWKDTGNASSAVLSVNGLTGDVELTGNNIEATAGDTTKSVDSHLQTIYNEIDNIDDSKVSVSTEIAGLDLSKDITSEELRTALNVQDGAEANVNADWNATSGDAEILNKPTLGTVADKNVSTDISSGDDIPTASQVRTYVANNGGKIDSISVNGTTRPIENKNVNIVVPTKTSELTNDKDFVTADDVSTTLAEYVLYDDIEDELRDGSSNPVSNDTLTKAFRAKEDSTYSQIEDFYERYGDPSSTPYFLDQNGDRQYITFLIGKTLTPEVQSFVYNLVAYSQEVDYTNDARFPFAQDQWCILGQFNADELWLDVLFPNMLNYSRIYFNTQTNAFEFDWFKNLEDTYTRLEAEDTFALKSDLDELKLFKFPNAVIVGEPTINNGQISDFTINDYMVFPFILDVGDRNFQIDFSFTTNTDVTTQQNIMDSKFGLALAIKNGKGLMAVSANGTSWASQAVGTINILSNTTYYARLTWNRLQFKTAISTDGINYTDDMSITMATKPYPRTIYIGGGNATELGRTPNPFKGIINMNKASLYIANQLIWQGMDDVGLATRADVSLSNLDELGTQLLIDNANSVIDDRVAIDVALKSEIPTKTSDLINDSGFITTSELPVLSGNIYIRDLASGIYKVVKKADEVTGIYYNWSKANKFNVDYDGILYVANQNNSYFYWKLETFYYVNATEGTRPTTYAGTFNNSNYRYSKTYDGISLGDYDTSFTGVRLAYDGTSSDKRYLIGGSGTSNYTAFKTNVNDNVYMQNGKLYSNNKEVATTDQVPSINSIETYVDNAVSGKMDKTGGTFTGDVTIDGKNLLLSKGNFICPKDTTQEILGVSLSSATLLGNEAFETRIRGSETRPKYNGNDLALASDIPSGLTSIDGLAGGTLTSSLILTGGSSPTNTANIQLDNFGCLTAKGTSNVIFGRTNSGEDLTVGNSAYNLKLYGSNISPTFNGLELAFKHEIPVLNGYATQTWVTNNFLKPQDAPVQTVNGKFGEVELTAEDVGALPNTTVIPDISNMATTNTEQTISASKTLDAPLIIKKFDTSAFKAYPAIKDEDGNDIFGYALVGGLNVGNANVGLMLRGSGERPYYNTVLRQLALYSDIPTVPTNTNQLTNGAGFITSSSLPTYSTASGSTNYGTLSNQHLIITTLSDGRKLYEYHGKLTVSRTAYTDVSITIPSVMQNPSIRLSPTIVTSGTWKNWERFNGAGALFSGNILHIYINDDQSGNKVFDFCVKAIK